MSASKTGVAEALYERRWVFSAGWKSLSLVDVYKATTFTLWLCGCNLKCPFCHNWRLAEGHRDVCNRLGIDEIIDALQASAPLIDYLHVTGGEPLLQWRVLAELFRRAKGMGVDISINTNMTLTRPLAILISMGLVDHVATDLKIPPDMLYGLPINVIGVLWRRFINSMKIVAEARIPLELRVPVADINYAEALNPGLVKELKELAGILNNNTEYYVIVQPLLGAPITTPRSEKWCDKYCNPSINRLYEVRDLLSIYGFSNIVVKETVHLG